MTLIPCKISDVGIEEALCDLSSFMNIMSLSVYESLNIGPLKDIEIRL